MHSVGRAIDFRMEGVENEDVVAFCEKLSDTGCGLYQNIWFVHIDVRDPGAGHVAWIDANGPGESPRYVSHWPLPDKELIKGTEEKKPADVLEHTSTKHTEAPATPESEPVDEHPAAPASAPEQPEKAPAEGSAKTAED